MIPPAVRALFRTTPTVAPVPHRAILSITGSQAAEFLNGIVASTVPSSPSCHFYTVFLHAQGRVLHDAFIYAHTTLDGKTGYLLEYDARSSEAPPLLPTLKRFVLRSKVRLRDMTDEYDVWQSWGTELDWDISRKWITARSGVIEPDWTGEVEWPWGQEAGSIRDRRAIGMGRRLLVKKGGRPVESSTHDIATPQAYELHRILHGVPEGITDIIPTHSFPMESNLDLMGALDFRKGCYVGQELTVRTYHTGVLRKRIWPVSIASINQQIGTLPAHLDIKTRLVETHDKSTGATRARPRGSGKLLSNTGGVGLALLRIEHVLAVENGEAKLEAELPSSGSADATTCLLDHWHPDGWPTIQNEPGL